MLGNLHAISQYLSTSAEMKLFLHGKNETGNTTLVMAADANAINNDGRSALMEAALWGRAESVKALLNANTDKRLRDHEGRCAMDLAQPARKNEKREIPAFSLCGCRNCART